MAVGPCSLLLPAEIETIRDSKVDPGTRSASTGGAFLVAQCFYTAAAYSKSVNLALTQRNPDDPAARSPKDFWTERFHRDKVAVNLKNVSNAQTFTVNGAIDAGDISLIKSKSGTSLPPRVQSQPPAAATVESSGEILGLAIGSSMQSAPEKLDPLRVPAIYTPVLKEASGRRIYWKLRETEFDWIMAWASPEGNITRLRAVYRPETAKPFQEIGDLETAASVTAEGVKWNLRRPHGSYFRLIAQGAGQRAQTVSMFSLELPGERVPNAQPDPEEQE